MSETAELVDRLRVWSRRFEVHSQERKLMLEAASVIEELAGPPPDDVLTVERVERALGGRKLLTWQVAALNETPPPSSSGR